MNFLAFSGLASFLLSSFLALFVLFHKRSRELHISLGFFSLSVALWTFGLWMGFREPITETDALFWGRFLNVSAILIPAFFFDFVCNFVQYKNKKVATYSIYSLCAVYLLLSLLFYPHFVAGVRPNSVFQFYPYPGKLYYLFPIIFAAIVLFSFILMWQYNRRVTGLQKTKNSYFIAATIMGFLGGGTTFPMVFDVNIYPLGVIGVSLLNLIMIYSLLKHRLLELSDVAGQLLIRCVSYVVLLLIFLGSYQLIGPDIQPTINQVIIGLFLLILFCETNFYLRNWLEKVTSFWLMKKRYLYQKLTKDLQIELGVVTGIEEAFTTLNRLIERQTNLDLTRFCVDKFFDLDKVDVDGVEFTDFGSGDNDASVAAIVSKFTKNNQQVFYQQACIEGAEKSIVKTFCHIPLLVDQQLSGFLVLTEKVDTTNHFSYDDEILFDFLSLQMDLTLTRISYHIRQIIQERKNTADKLKLTKALAGSIAHEVRNPLGQVQHCLSTISEALPRVSDEVAEALSRGQAAIRGGLQIIDITLSQVREKALDPGSFVYLSAAAVTRRAVESYAYEKPTDRDKVFFQVENDFIFKGDATAYSYIIFNLMKNALYYFEEGKGQLLILVYADRSGHGVRVRDNGPGIPAAKIDQLFDHFFTSGKEGGTGLGLTYCKRTMQAFGGSISCDSMEGFFTEFSLQFPILSAEELRHYHETLIEQARQVLQGRKVLLVGEETSMSLQSRYNLGALHCQMTLTDQESLAIDFLRQDRYDIVLVDLDKAYSLTKKIRAAVLPTDKTALVVAYTGDDRGDFTEDKLRNLGVDSVVNRTQICHLPQFAVILQDLIGSETVPKSVSLAGKVILIADDQQINRLVVKALLASTEATFVEAEHGRFVLEQLAKLSRCDLILMDIQMPQMNGIQATEIIRQQPGPFQHIPIIGLSGQSDEELIKRVKIAGMTDFLTKPANKETLIACIQKNI